MPPPPPPPPGPRRSKVSGGNGNGNVSVQPKPPPPSPYHKSEASAPSMVKPNNLGSSTAPQVRPSKVYEPYGKIQIPSSSYTGMSHRNTNLDAQRKSSYVLPSTSREGTNLRSTQKNRSSVPSYSHNLATLSFLLPTLASILWWHDSIIVLQIFLFVALGLYALDLSNSRDGIAVGVWIGALSMTLASGYGTLLQMDDSNATGISMISCLLQLSVEGFSFCSWACWITLQFQWLYTDLPLLAKGMELTLHSMVPPICSVILTNHLLRILENYWGKDSIATLAPFVFALLMMMGMMATGCSSSSFESKRKSTADGSTFIISSFSAQIHTMVLLLVPGMMYVLTFRDRIFSQYANFDEIFDLILVWTIPYLLQCIILGLFEKSPYSLPRILFPKHGNTTLRGAFVPGITTLVTSIAAQQRYLIPICNNISYQFNGHNLASPWIVSLYLTTATVASLFAIWMWGRTSSVTNELFFGEYHEDIIQLSISVSGMFFGKAFGIPWNLTPLPILAFLGFSVWLSTKMLRYLCIFLFVIHAAGVVIFGYRYASIDIKVPLAIQSIEVGLVRLGMAEVCCSVLIGIVVGFVARPKGGFADSFLKRVDVPGIILFIYTLLLAVLEVTLIRQRVTGNIPSREIDSDVEDSDAVYSHATALITSFLLIGISGFMRRVNLISKVMFVTVFAFSLGKAIAFFIDASEVDNKIRTERVEQRWTQLLLFRVLVTSVLILVMLIPSAVLNPIHMKSGSKYRSQQDGQLSSIPSTAYRNISLYSLLLLPSTLIASVPSVLSPLVMALSIHYKLGSYYSMALPLSETIGVGISLWGISTLYMLNHYLPDRGLESWKKTSALALLMGLGLTLSAPTVPEWVVGDNDLGITNAYAGISSLGSRLMTQGHNRTGGWGILSASLATLLAIIGPFDLRERRHPSGRKDKTHFLRLMMFSMMFGCGLSWFITILSMSQEDFFTLAITTLSCMVLSFFGTVTCVLGYHIELENFNEVIEMAKMSSGVFLLFLIITCISSFMVQSVPGNLFSQGACLSTYLTVASCVTLSFVFALRSRVSKNQASRSMCNLSCCLCYGFAVVNVLGRLGTAGLDAELGVTLFMGVPQSILGIICISVILLALEGEGSAETRSRVSRVSTISKKSSKVLGITMRNLNASNRYVPPVAGTILVFYLAGLYNIFLRGSPFFDSKLNLKGAGSTLADFLGKNKNILGSLVENASSNSRAFTLSNSLEGSGFWTATSIFGPIVHVAGLLATIPSAYLFLSQNWYGTRRSNSQILPVLPLNILPILFCKGTPMVRALGVILLFWGIVQMTLLKQNGNRSHMRF